jgi:hypothetical protein
LLARENQQLHRLSGSLHTLYQDLYCNIDWSEDSQKAIQKETTDTINISNQYTEQVVRNNRQMVNVIRTKFWMAEPDDYGHFDAILEDITRIDVELDEKLIGKLPLRVVLKQDKIYFTRGDALSHIMDKFEQKRRKLDETTRSRWFVSGVLKRTMFNSLSATATTGATDSGQKSEV